MANIKSRDVVCSGAPFVNCAQFRHTACRILFNISILLILPRINPQKLPVNCW